MIKEKQKTIDKIKNAILKNQNKLDALKPNECYSVYCKYKNNVLKLQRMLTKIQREFTEELEIVEKLEGLSREQQEEIITYFNIKLDKNTLK
jgi:hypothetical protein